MYTYIKDLLFPLIRATLVNKMLYLEILLHHSFLYFFCFVATDKNLNSQLTLAQDCCSTFLLNKVLSPENRQRIRPAEGGTNNSQVQNGDGEVDVKKNDTDEAKALFKSLHRAILFNQADFVKVLTDNVVPLNEFCTPIRLLELYQEVSFVKS